LNLPEISVAAIFHSPRTPFEICELQVPLLKPGQLLVEIQLCTICGSDLHTFDGRRNSPSPSILGHEMVGRLIWPNNVVDGVGNLLRAGERLIWSLIASCGGCVFCNSDLPQKCESLQKYGHNAITASWSLSGGFAEYCVLLPETFFLKVPDQISDAVAAPATCSTATVTAAIAAAGSVKSKSVMVMGAGMLGQTACAMLESAGATTIIAADANLERGRLAGAFGAKYTLDPSISEKDFTQCVLDHTNGYGVDIALDFSGANDAIRRAIKVLRPAGACLLVGSVYPQPADTLHYEDIVRRMLILRGIYNYAPIHLIGAVEFLLSHSHRYPFEQLVGRTFSLRQVDQAFKLAGGFGAPFRVGICPNLRDNQP
jgi:putative phosphonate catabolism associated alcohol dehydrogenase